MRRIVADLHLHSSYARATSKNLNFDTLTAWARIKGIDLLSSADFTHPVWFTETKEKLKEDGSGLLSYQGLHFILGGEVSCIFSQGGKLRRVHLLIFVPTLEAAEKVNKKLGEKGKLSSDGRPILGMSVRNVLEILLEADEKAIMIPAHIWTPWFGILGAFGGFDSLEEAYGDLAPYIYGVETGLSSDPAMNWRIKELDKRAIVSFSDAHSAAKMGRELTIFNTDVSYPGILEALKKQRIEETVEFFPEEGKYHLNGHRNCNFKETPAETLKRSYLCPVCRRSLTIGVLQRVEQLAEKTRGEDFVAVRRPGFTRLVPLQEIIAEVIKAPVASKRTVKLYQELIEKFVNELDILTNLDPNLLEKEVGLPRLAEALRKVRKGDIFIDAGYDGVYGVVKIWPEETLVHQAPKLAVGAKKAPEKQMSLFEKR